jgi:hypothetical protein
MPPKKQHRRPSDSKKPGQDRSRRAFCFWTQLKTVYASPSSSRPSASSRAAAIFSTSHFLASASSSRSAFKNSSAIPAALCSAAASLPNRSLTHLEPVSGRTNTEIGKGRTETAAPKPAVGALKFEDCRPEIPLRILTYGNARAFYRSCAQAAETRLAG